MFWLIHVAMENDPSNHQYRYDLCFVYPPKTCWIFHRGNPRSVARLQRLDRSRARRRPSERRTSTPDELAMNNQQATGMSCWKKHGKTNGWLVVWYTYPSEKYEFVNWDDYIFPGTQYM